MVDAYEHGPSVLLSVSSFPSKAIARHPQRVPPLVASPFIEPLRMSIPARYTSSPSFSSRTRRRPAGRATAMTVAASTLFALLGVLAVLATPRRAAAASGAATADEIAEMNRRASDEYESLNFDKARKTLTAALEACQRAGLTRHRVAADAHLLMGLVILAGDVKRTDDAAAEFRRALEIRPSIQVPERLANPEIQQVFAQAAAPESQTTDASAGKPGGRTPAGTRRRAPGSAASDTGAEATAEAEAEDEGGDGEDDEGSGTEPSSRSWFIGFAAGSGMGWASGNGEVTDARVQSGFHAAAVAHLLPEVGYFLRPNLLLSAQLRVQFVSGASSEPDPSMTMCGTDHVCSASKGATAVFAKAAWFLGDGTTFRPYLAAMLGFGQIRHVASVPGLVACGTDAAHPAACTDTVAAGPVFVGPGGGFLISLAPRFALVVGTGALLGLSRFTFHLDLDAGLAVEL